MESMMLMIVSLIFLLVYLLCFCLSLFSRLNLKFVGVVVDVLGKVLLLYILNISKEISSLSVINPCISVTGIRYRCSIFVASETLLLLPLFRLLFNLLRPISKGGVLVVDDVVLDEDSVLVENVGEYMRI